MLQEKAWKLKYSILFILILLILVGCEGQVEEPVESEITETNLVQKRSILEDIERFKDVKFGLGEKFFVEGIDFLSTMNYDRATYSFNKSIFYNPIPPEAKYFLAKSYLNSGRIRNAIQILEEISSGELSSFVLPKISSIYSRLSYSFGDVVPKKYFSLTNIPSIVGNKKLFSLPSSLRASKTFGVLMNSFGDNRFISIDDQFELYSFNTGRRITDMVYDEERETFWILTFSEIYQYRPGWFNLNLFDINIHSNFKYNGVNFKKFIEMGEFLYVLDTISRKVIVISKDDGSINFSFPDNPLVSPTDIETDNGSIYVSDNTKIKSFDKYGNFKEEFDVNMTIRGFCIHDNSFIIATDDGIYIIPIKGKDQVKISEKTFDDVVFGYDKKIYAINTERGELEVFGNIYLHTHNLDVDVKGIFVQKFPTIGIVVGVRDIDQNVLNNLKNENFEVLESGASILIPEVEPTYGFLKRKSIYIVIEKSKAVYEYLDNIKSFLREILNKLSAYDHINLSIVGDTIVEMGKTNTMVLYPIDFIERNFKSFEDSYRILDGIDRGITEMLYSLRNNAVLVITSGDLEADNSYRDIQTLIDYAYYNLIPVYVLSINQNTHLETLANTSGGKYYDKSILLSPDIFLKDYQKNRIFRYLIVFRSLYENLYPDQKIVDVEVRVKYNGMLGKDMIKYVFPKTKKPEQ